MKFKKLHSNAILPKHAKPGDAGADLVAVSKEWDEEKEKLVFGTGLAVEIPEGFVGLLFPRSSICKTLLSLSNAVGVIDSGYRGEIKFFFNPGHRPKKNYEVGDRIGQLVIVPYVSQDNNEFVDELSETERGSKGFGSSGR